MTNTITKVVHNNVEYEIKNFEPSSDGTQGQVLTKGASGYDWETPQSGLPSGGSTGQILVMTANGPAWATPESVNIVVSDTNAPIPIRKIWGGTDGDYSNVQTYNENEAYLTVPGTATETETETETATA